LARRKRNFSRSESGTGNASAQRELPTAAHGTNPFDYLAELQRHPEEMTRNPPAWMPWNQT